MKKTKGIIWGVVIAVVGILWGLREAGIIDRSLYFDGWWTLFIIVPSVIGLVTEKDKKGSLICLVIGVALFANSYFELWQYKKYLLPLVIVVVGVAIVLNNIFDKQPEQVNFPIDENSEQPQFGQPTYIPQSSQDYYAAFSGEEYRFDNGFAGGNFRATFGGITLDIRNADIVHNCVINTSAIFGGVDIYVPQDVRVVVRSTSIFGGTSDKSNKTLPSDSKTVFVNATNLFGGTEIK